MGMMDSILGVPTTGKEFSQAAGKATQDTIKKKGPAEFGKELIAPGIAKDTNDAEGQVANGVSKAIAEKLPSSPKLNFVPAVGIGYGTGGIGGAASAIGSQMSNMFKSSGGLNMLPPGTGDKIVDQFKNSPAVTEAANDIAPTINDATTKAIGQTSIGKGINTVMNPGSMMEDLAKKHNMTKTSFAYVFGRSLADVS